MNLLQLKSLSGKEGNAWRFSFLLLFLWIVAGCNNMPEEMPAMSGDELRLGMGIRTRASDTAFERMDQIGLYAVQWADDVTSGVLQSSGNYADNTCFTLLDPSQDWRGVPPVYYPADNRKLDLYAYYPYRENAFLPGTTSIGLSVQPNQSIYANYTFSDFVVAKKEGIQKTMDKVNLSFSHKLSQVVFQLKNGDGFTLKQLQSAQITIKNVIIDAKYNLAAGNYAFPETGGFRTDIVPYGKWDMDVVQGKLVGVKAIVMPQELNTSACIEIMIGERLFLKRFSMPVMLGSGESRIFTITLNNIGGSAPEMLPDSDISTELNPWENSATVEDDAEEIVPSDDFILEVVTNTQNIEIHVVKTDEDINVDWGDGHQDKNVFQHRYSTSPPHTIKFYGSKSGLVELRFPTNSLESLDVTNSIGLEYLDCSVGQLTTLNISRQSKLKYLDCSNNNLTTLNIDNNKKLIGLLCMFNQLTSLNLDNQSDLVYVTCLGNRLDNLNLSNCLNLVKVYCSINPFINTPEIINVANSLPDRTGKERGTFRISDSEPWMIELLSSVRPFIEPKNWVAQ